MEVKKCECGRSNDDRKENVDTINLELKAMVDKIAKTEGLTNYELFVKNIASDGNNFLGLLTEVTVHDNDSKNDIHLFVKTIIPNAEDLKLFCLPEVYRTEIFVYTELSKLLEKLQSDANIPLDERYKFVKSYGAINAQHIIMDNMAEKGYTIWNRFEIITLEFAEKCVKQLAKFHALGFVLEEKHSSFFEDKIMPLRYLVTFNEEFKKFYVNSTKAALDYLEDSARSKLEKHLTPLYEKTEQYAKDRFSTLTLCHGDFRTGNVLYRSEEGSIADVVPVDYQLIHYGSPLIDVIYFIYGSTDREFRRKYLDYLKNVYYDSLEQFLKYFERDVQKYYPKEEFEKLFEERIDYGLFLALWFLQGNLSTGDGIADLSKTQASEVSFGHNDLTKARIRDLVDEFIDWGYL